MMVYLALIGCAVVGFLAGKGIWSVVFNSKALKSFVQDAMNENESDDPKGD